MCEKWSATGQSVKSTAVEAAEPRPDHALHVTVFTSLKAFLSQSACTRTIVLKRRRELFLRNFEWKCAYFECPYRLVSMPPRGPCVCNKMSHPTKQLRQEKKIRRQNGKIITDLSARSTIALLRPLQCPKYGFFRCHTQRQSCRLRANTKYLAHRSLLSRRSASNRTFLSSCSRSSQCRPDFHLQMMRRLTSTPPSRPCKHTTMSHHTKQLRQRKKIREEN